MHTKAVAITPKRAARRKRAIKDGSQRAHEQQVVAAVIQAAQDCTREVRLMIGKRRDRSVARVINSGARGTSAMQNNNDAIGSKLPERSDWSEAFEAVSRLAAARELALQEIGRDQPEASHRKAANEQHVAP